MRHIVTGGLGFTGRHLVNELASRREDIVIFDCDRPTAALPSCVRFVHGDIRDPACLETIGLKRGDVVYHLAARQFHANVPYCDRDRWFCDVNVNGTRNVVNAMERSGATDLVFFSTDMVYGLPEYSPVPTSHPRCPLGPYGRSKCKAENLLAGSVRRGSRITVFRPRMIMGAGRLGILSKLFRLIATGLPVPLIGDGLNRYQMVSVHDCVSAALRAVEAGLPAGPFNLGSQDPPMVRDLLQALINRVGSRSHLLPTPAGPVKAALSVLDGLGLTLLHPEQFRIADQDYILDLSDTATSLGFTPKFDDREMLVDAYAEYTNARRPFGGGKAD